MMMVFSILVFFGIATVVIDHPAEPDRPMSC